MIRYLQVQSLQHLHSGLKPKLDLTMMQYIESWFKGNAYIWSVQLGTALDAKVAGVDLREPPQLQSCNQLLGSCPAREHGMVCTDRLLFYAHCTWHSHQVLFEYHPFSHFVSHCISLCCKDNSLGSDDWPALNPQLGLFCQNPPVPENYLFGRLFT